ncbi:MAG: calcium-binding protein [Rhodospirillales bacterium]
MANIPGTNGNDTLFSLSSVDTLEGFEGNDIFVWNQGDARDLFLGGTGNDTILTRTANFQGLQNSFDAGADSVEAIGYDSNANNQANAGKDLTISANNGEQVWNFASATFLNDDVSVFTGGGEDTVTASDTSEGTYFGGNNADLLTGGAVRDVLIGGSGDDVMSGNDGGDTLIGGAGGDEMSGGAERDLFIWNGGHGRDSFDGGDGNDTILSRSANFEGLQNSFDAGADSVEAIGYDSNANNQANAGKDLTISANNGEQVWNFASATFLNDDVTVSTGGGEDTVTASDSSEGTYFGGNNADVMIGGAQTDVINAGSSNDLGVFYGAHADQGDTYNGGAGSGDKLRIGLTPEQLTDGAIGSLVPFANALLAEIDAYRAHIASDPDVPFTFTQFGNDAVADLTAVNWETVEIGIVVNGKFHSLEDCLAKGIDSVLIGDKLANTLAGDSANNLILGLSGNDVINGGQGHDCIFGGANNDTIEVRGNEAEFDHMSGGGGSDRVVNVGGSNITFDAFNTEDDIEALDANNKEVRGNGSANDFDFSGVKMIDVASVKAGGSDDVVRASDQTGGIDYFGGTGSDQLIGDKQNDLLHGDAGNDTLTGGSGVDVLDGGAGKDDLDGGANNDTIEVRGNEAEFDAMSGGGGSDRVVNVGGSHVTFDLFNTDDDIEVLDANGKEVRGNGGVNDFDFEGVKLIDVAAIKAGGSDDLVKASDETGGISYFGGTGSDQIIGDNQNDLLFGDAGSDTLVGGSGNDVLDGGAGSDEMTGGAGNDTFAFDGGMSGDEGTVTDFGVGNDLFRINVNGNGTGAAYVGDAAFSAGGEASARFEDGTLEVDTNGNGNANFAVELQGIASAGELTGGDFLFT